MLNDNDYDEYEIDGVAGGHWSNEDTERNDPGTSDSCSSCYEAVAENSVQSPESATGEQNDEHTDEDPAQLQEITIEQGERDPIEQNEGEGEEEGEEGEEESPEHTQENEQQQNAGDVVEETSEEENILSSKNENDEDDWRIAGAV